MRSRAGSIILVAFLVLGGFLAFTETVSAKRLSPSAERLNIRANCAFVSGTDFLYEGQGEIGFPSDTDFYVRQGWIETDWSTQPKDVKKAFRSKATTFELLVDDDAVKSKRKLHYDRDEDVMTKFFTSEFRGGLSGDIVLTGLWFLDGAYLGGDRKEKMPHSRCDLLVHFSSPGPPAAPQNLQATAGDGQVDLTWQAPTLDGGSPVTGYRIYRGTTSGNAVFLLEVDSLLAYTDTGLTNGITYHYQVSATNVHGEGTRSDEVSATPTTSTAPQASFTLAPEVGNSATTFMADASSSLDAEDPPEALEFRWDWEDDGTWDTMWTDQPTAGHQYASPGIYTIRLGVKDLGGLTDEATRQVVVDDIPPATTAEPSGTFGQAGWFRSSVGITLTAVDDLSGVALVAYRIDGGVWEEYTSPFTVDGDGIHALEHRAMDGAGNVEAANRVDIKIDTAAPETSFGADGTLGENGWYVSLVRVTLAASDATSGVATIVYRIDGG
ncbi:MAG: fibronectin type III domain-containing protein, partial [Thermoplasmata archaeon]